MLLRCWKRPPVSLFPRLSRHHLPFSAIKQLSMQVAGAESQSQQPQTKKQRLSERKIIGTHNGTFHCDEALAVFLLRQTPAYREAGVVRSRDPPVLDKCDIVVDVGAVYGPERHRYDHHQREFTEVFGHGFSTKLSSAGLIYKHFGKEIIKHLLGSALSNSAVDTLWLKLYKEFIEAIDAIDNGVPQYLVNGTPRYVNKTDLSSRVGWLNPAWNEPSDSNKADMQFEKASSLTGSEFMGRLQYYASAWLPARDIVAGAVASRSTVHPTGKIVLLQKYAPWKEHLTDIEEDLHIAEDGNRIIYVVYPDETSGTWRVQAVSVHSNSFESRKALPPPWRGVRDERLSQLTGIPGCIFVHTSGFIGGNASKEGALTMARIALDFQEETA